MGPQRAFVMIVLLAWSCEMVMKRGEGAAAEDNKASSSSPYKQPLFKPINNVNNKGNGIITGTVAGKGAGASGLSVDFYKASCPHLEQVIEQKVRAIVEADPGQAAGILRIMFHDCFVQGCDASILLVKPVTELIATPNNASIRASSLRALEAIKAAVEEVCPHVVSCADTIALSTAAAVRLVGGPGIPMETGRRDSSTAASNQTVVNNIPPPTLNISALKQNFQNHGLDIKDLVSLSGGHTIGQAHCRFVDPQITPTISTDLNVPFALNLSRICLPTSNPAKAGLTVHLDFITKNLFDNAYFQNVLSKTVIFHTDAALLNASDTMQLVELYAENQPLFFQQFSISMVKMSQLGVLTGEKGIIRRKCTLPN